MDKLAFDRAWGASKIPAAAFAPGTRALLWHNPPAEELAARDLFASLPEPEAQLLSSALGGGQVEAPLFLHLGGEVYSAVVLPGEDVSVCLFQLATDYYSRTQDALDQAIMASKAKTNFLSEMSHDIRTPMGAIVGLTDIALSQEGAPTKVVECLEKIRVASGHMMSLLNEVLDMSRIESGRVQIQAEQSNVADLLHEILIVAKPQADSNGLSFSLEMGRVVRENLLLDAVRLKQVCLNLLSNAIKYTPRGGSVELHFAVDPGDSPDQVRMHLWVKDTGLGMSKEFLTKLFSPFEREEKSSVHKIQGTGLGMAITKNLVELMGGRIQVESETDKGSCFTLDIPFQAVPEQEGLGRGLAGQRVLLLESDERQAELTLRLLGGLGMETDWARSAGDAVMFLNDLDLDGLEYYAVLTAESLEGCEVTQLLPQLRARLGTRLPILLLTDSDWSQIEYIFTRSGVDSFIPLPLFRSRLAAALCTCSVGSGPQEPAQTRCDLTGLRLLLAEDNELNREIAQELIGESGAQIDCAEDGRQAVDIFSSSPPGAYDAILMDIQMPVMNGLDAAREIRSLNRPDAGGVPIIAMTANAFVEDVKNSLEAGMDAHISKPLDIDKVFSTIDSLTRGRRT